MTDTVFLETIKNMLLNQRKEILSHIPFEQDLHVDTDGDEIDEIQGNLLLAMQKQLLTRNNTKVSKIDKALRQIEDGTYGICEDCEDHIPQKRLLINPYTTICVDCAEDREMEEKQNNRDK